MFDQLSAGTYEQNTGSTMDRMQKYNCDFSKRNRNNFCKNTRKTEIKTLNS